MRERFWRMFWGGYARVYDSISHLEPYRGMIDDLCRPACGASSVLDAGCGTGNACLRLERAGVAAELTAVDGSEVMLARARRKLGRTRVLKADLDAPLAFPDASFDVVLCSNVLYSLPRPLRTLQEFRRVLRPGGTLMCSNPRERFRIGALMREHLRGGPSRWWSLAWNGPGLLVATVCTRAILANTDWTRFNFFSREELESLFRQAGLERVRIGTTYGEQDWLVEAKRPLAE
jgi:ubiquinone/menaquinone biosynthesis C-methylase UbiE